MSDNGSHAEAGPGRVGGEFDFPTGFPKPTDSAILNVEP